MKLVEVTDKKEENAFIRLPHKLYRNDLHWIAPLHSEIRAIFDHRHNSYFQHGSCCRWLLYQDEKPVGRIAAFVNHHKLSKGQRTGGAGFFECIDDPQAAALLFNAARQWLAAQGLDSMEAPINFGENDRYWGLLVEGFKPPSMGMNYHPPYYQSLFEAYGFRKAYDQYTNLLDARVPLPERFRLISDRIRRNPDYRFLHFNPKQFDRFARHFQEIYNDAWQDFDHFTPLSREAITDSFRQMKPVMDEKIIWFAYHQQEPVAFVLCLPDVNPILKKVNGRLNGWGKIKFLWYRRTTRVRRLRIIVMGCKKGFRNRGLESALIRCLQEEVLPRRSIQGVELAWVGDYNPKMVSIHEATGAVRDKVHRTYRYAWAEEQKD